MRRKWGGWGIRINCVLTVSFGKVVVHKTAGSNHCLEHFAVVKVCMRQEDILQTHGKGKQVVRKLVNKHCSTKQ